MDFIVQLPELIGCKNIMVIINYLEKDFIIVPVKWVDAETVAEIFLNHFIRNHGLPDIIVSDRGRAFIESLWKHLYQLLKIMRRLSTAFHPEINRSTK